MKSIPVRLIINFLFLSLFFFACSDLKNLDVTKDLKFILNYKPADSFIEAQVKDAKTGQLILDKINIEIIGTQSANVINFEGEAKTSYTKKGPSIYLGLRNITPTSTTPVNFKILVGADGYLSSSKDVALTGIGNAPIEILLVKTSTPPAGAVVQQSTLGATATGTTQDKLIEVQNGQNSTLIEIDKGTVLKDSKGSILTGNLQTTVATFSGDSKDAAKSLPGGNFISLEKGPTGAKDVKATILPIAFAAVELKDASGNKVKNFTQPVDISFEISPNTINPKTNKKIKVGEKISVLSYNENSATWTYDKEGIIIQKGSEYFVTFPTNHLSWFAVGDYWVLTAFNYTIDPNEVQVPEYYNSLEYFGINLTMTDQLTSVNNANFNLAVSTIPFEYELHFPAGVEGGSARILSGTSTMVGMNGFNDYFYNFINLPTIAEKLVIKINLGDEVKVFEIKDLKSYKSGDRYKIEVKRKWSKLKTIYPSVSCENNCPIEIKPYNIGIECLFFAPNLSIASTDTWFYLGAVNYDNSDGKTKLKAYLPDNVDIWARANSYPEYVKQINTGSGDNFIVPIVLTKDHPLCKCGK